MNPIRGLSNKGFSEMVQWFDIRRVVQYIISEVCPIKSSRRWSSGLILGDDVTTRTE